MWSTVILRWNARSMCIGLAIVLLLALASASSGDRQREFKHCVSSCVKADCSENAKPLPLRLQLLFWTCESNCDYKCQRKLTSKARQPGKHSHAIHQYHGKWPFVRIFGVQEPASVIFSILNGVMHLQSWKLVRDSVPKIHPMRRWLSLFVVLGSWSWFCSTIFHMRDFPLTEKLDYFSAGLNVLYIFFLGMVRALRLGTWRETRVLAIACAVPYCLHVAYLSFVHFDYGYNMMANAIVGLLSNVVWFIVTFQAYYNGQPFWWKPAVLIILTDLAFSLEAFDFPPLFDTFDAHSLWHAATIPIVSEWYKYLVKDAKWDMHLEQQRKG
ncbi:hypothetical protein GGI25_004956 [Coemansia spiralis]|uniref:Post-GPI attachment to proteins factor 3 n=2 Tax=Coemansia TaxID=4863 RepID=A0A9W8FZH2_9FUNG|nr:PER1 protein [Coemansia spiralis]KAJ1989024.1 hypothetical protein EDC05_004945 [Coemansia umbellata]KAJ2620331.1 hypothetical protein GGI26_005098 [Coemansia sp. RSA 1358]KAJ2672806.1 hypothetical protein GGI25_004956 [Coemansia spiralis]